MRTIERSRVRPPGPNMGMGGYGGRSLAIRRDPLASFLTIARTYGDMAFLKAGPLDLYLVSDPEAIREVLVTKNAAFMKGQALQEAKRVLGEGLLTSEGDLHRRQRLLIQPAFHHGRIAVYGEAMAGHAAGLADGWTDGDVIDAHADMTRLTLTIVGTALFGTDLANDASSVATALSTAFELFDRLTLPYGGYLDRLPLPSTRRFHQAKASLDEVVFRMIRDRRESGHRGDDLLSMLLSAQDHAAGGMSDRQIRDEAMTIFLAGHETTANALTWTWYLLSQHPVEEARLHEEVDRLPEGRLPQAGDVSTLPFTKRALTEAIRLYPPAWIIGRRALQDVEIGGYLIPARSIVVVSPYIVHHDRRWFPDPWRFDPDRWLPERVAERPRFSYFPFGGGSRLCIGEDFAWMEGVLVLATIARAFRLRLVPGHPIELLPRVTLRPKHGMRMRLERRR